MIRTLVHIPKTARKGEDFEIKVILSHPMETGFRIDAEGKPIPRHILREFVCRYLGDEVFRADMFPAISANPFFSFFAVADRTGPVTLAWTDDRGERRSETAVIVVE